MPSHESTTLVPLTDREIVHVRTTLCDERKRLGKIAPELDDMVDGLIEKLTAQPSKWRESNTRRQRLWLFLLCLVLMSIVLQWL